MITILNTGQTGTGKSTIFRENVIEKRKNCFVWDVQNEYKLPFYSNKIEPQFKYYGDFDFFLDIVECLPVRGNYNIMVEEATGLFKGHIGKRFTNIILSKRHTGTNWWLNFHGLQSVPPDIKLFTDLLFLRKTNDIDKNVKEKWGLEIYEKWTKLKKSSDNYACELINMSNLV